MKYILLFALFLTSCATGNTLTYGQICNTWKGHNVNDLIRSWGPPSSTFDMQKWLRKFGQAYK